MGPPPSGGVSAPVKECQFCHSEPFVIFAATQQKECQKPGGLKLPHPA